MVNDIVNVPLSFNNCLSSQSFSVNQNPQIYVACLSSYNNGILYGAWIDASQEVGVIYQEIKEILSKSPMPNAEEWAIHDCEGFGSLGAGEYEHIESIQAKAQFILEHGELGAELISHYAGHLEDAQYAIENCYHGQHDSELAYASDFFDDYYLEPAHESIKYYIDYEAFKRDIFISDYFSIDVGGKIHVFSFH